MFGVERIREFLHQKNLNKLEAQRNQFLIDVTRSEIAYLDSRIGNGKDFKRDNANISVISDMAFLGQNVPAVENAKVKGISIHHFPFKMELTFWEVQGSIEIKMNDHRSSIESTLNVDGKWIVEKNRNGGPEKELYRLHAIKQVLETISKLPNS